MKSKFFYGIIAAFLVVTSISCKKKDTVPAEPTSVTDIDGNIYNVVKICGKFWTVENLKTARYKDGVAIPTSLTNTQWEVATIGAFSIYDDVTTNNATYGKLYNWFAASSGKLAPEGWHVATEAEWTELVTCLGGTTVAGGKMKAVSPLWNVPNLGADNSSRFSALPAGFRGSSGAYNSKGSVTYFWGSDQRSTTQGEYLVLNTDLQSAAFNGANKQFGYSVRCVKD